jgi:hypothetical protein
VSAIFPVASMSLYLAVGAVSLLMAWKSIVAQRFLPFHEAAAGKEWKDVDPRLQAVYIAILGISGCGFLVVGLMLVLTPVIAFHSRDTFVRLAMPMLAILYSVGLALANFRLHVTTGARTPWRGSLYAAAVVALAAAVSLVP